MSSWVCPLCDKRVVIPIEEHYKKKHYNVWLSVNRSVRVHLAKSRIS